jgi:hypothetical protein
MLGGGGLKRPRPKLVCSAIEEVEEKYGPVYGTKPSRAIKF